MNVELPTIDDIANAARRIRSHAVMTPLLRSDALDELCGGRILIKVEALQRTGTFKFRGAFNRISQLNEDEVTRGVLAWSSGNHAQGVAAAAALVGAPATIVMPSDAPTPKVENTRTLGAEVVFYDRYTESREDIGTAIAKERGATIVPPYDDPHIIAGQGTAGLEAAAQAGALGMPLDHALSPCGGGGLIAGCALALTNHFPAIGVHPVEPLGFDDTTRSLSAGERVSNDPAARSLCDALLAPEPGEVTFALNQRLLSDGLVVSDKEALDAVAWAYRNLRVVVEPGGAVALAAVLSGRFACTNTTTLVIVSGGNIAPEMFIRALSSD